MPKKLNYYELLELYPAATQEEIEKSFRDMLYKYHPDHNPERPDWAHEKTAEVVEAYKVLSDPRKRKVYNFLIFAGFKEKLKERKFSIFQIKDKKKYEEAAKYFYEGVDLYINRDKRKDALIKFQQSYGIYKTAEAMYNIGVIYISAGKFDDALRAFKETMRLEPENNSYKRILEKAQELKREIELAKKGIIK